MPWRGAFEIGTSLGVHNYPTNFYDLVREGKVKIVFDEVQRFQAGREVVLESGRMEVDAVVCATGWEVGNGMRWEPEGLEREVGVPTVSESLWWILVNLACCAVFIPPSNTLSKPPSPLISPQLSS